MRATISSSPAVAALATIRPSGLTTLLPPIHSTPSSTPALATPTPQHALASAPARTHTSSRPRASAGVGLSQPLERLRRHLALEELIEVAADLLGEVRGQRHLGVHDQLDAVTGRALQEHEHALDDLLARRAFVVGAHLGGGDLYLARHAGSFACPRDGRGGAPC